MAKKPKEHNKSCAECIHEDACRGWTNGRSISDESASRCPNHTTVKNSAAYLCGVLDERKRKQTNADHIRSMISTDEGLAEALLQAHDGGMFIPFCKNKPECVDLLEEGIIPQEECKKCMIEWIREPYKGDDTNAEEETD